LAGVLAVTVATIAVVDVAAVTELRHYLLSRTDSTLQTVLDLTEPHLAHLVRQSRRNRPSPILQAGLGAYDYDYLAFVPDQGPTVVLDASPGAAPALPDNLAALAADGQARTVGERHGSAQLRLRAARTTGGTLVVSAGLDEVNRTVGHLVVVLAVGSALAVAVIAAGTILIVRRGLHPLETMATQADRINAGDLTDRVSAPDAVSEVGRLGTALNGMLDRIETSVNEREAGQESMRRFFADASHELRTPLASLRANAELHQQGALPERAQVDEAMRRIGLEATRMTRLVDDMLRLARLDQHPDHDQAPVDVSALVADGVARTSAADPGREWRTQIDAGMVVVGDEELLRRAVDNLLANVRVHTPEGTTATVTVTRRGANIAIDVSDGGPGVPTDRLADIFERFTRVGAQPTRPGSGLGLAIVAETAAVHGGTVTAAGNRPHGLCISVVLPDASDRAGAAARRAGAGAGAR
jgi:two-component system OmpR family sensor kinase